MSFFNLSTAAQTLAPSTTAPALTVNATGGGTLQLANGSGNTFIADANGNVGIGTGVPLSKLDVNGDLMVNGYILNSRRIAVYQLNDPTNTSQVTKTFSISTGDMSFNNTFISSDFISLGVDNTTFTFNTVGIYKCTWYGYVISNTSNTTLLSVSPNVGGSITVDGAYPHMITCLPNTVGAGTGVRQFICNVSSAGATLKIRLTPNSNDPNICRFFTFHTNYYVRFYIEYL